MIISIFINIINNNMQQVTDNSKKLGIILIDFPDKSCTEYDCKSEKREQNGSCSGSQKSVFDL